MTKIVLAFSLVAALFSSAEAGWHGRTDMFGTHWRNDAGGPTITCRNDMFGTHCN